MQQKHGLIDPETIELIPIDGGTTLRPAEQIIGPRLIRQWLAKHRVFVVTVILPTVLAVVYFGLIAADRFESESKFVVRSPGTAAASHLTSLVQGTGISRSSDDAYIVHAYMRSRDALRKLADQIDLLRLLDRPEADLVWRYPSPFLSHNAERLLRHFNSFLDIDYDHSTGITTLRVQAFRPEDAKIMAEALLRNGEELINRLSERAQKDAIRNASEEVERTRERARAALDRITEFRRANAIVDPGRVSNASLETITRLALEVAQTNAQLAELQKSSPDSPQTNSFKFRIAALEEQIQRERALLAGADRSLAPLIAEYERLVLEREFAERTFASAQTALDIARVDAQRQQLFLERISTPALADYATYPQRLLGIFGTFAVCLMLFFIGRRIVSDTRSHGGL